jgi:hypothetical protein
MRAAFSDRLNAVIDALIDVVVGLLVCHTWRAR